jgi:hypothetical protein
MQTETCAVMYVAAEQLTLDYVITSSTDVQEEGVVRKLHAITSSPRLAFW